MIGIKGMVRGQQRGLVGLMLVIAVATILAGSVSAQSIAGTDMSSELEALRGDDSATGEDWMSLADRALRADDLETAEAALAVAAESASPVRIGLARARIAAHRGDTDASIAHLRDLLDAGFTGVSLITSDAELSGLAGTPAYDALVAEMSVLAYPCAHDPRFAEFDFWVGEWDVTVAGGQLAGSNRIERAESGCVLTEHWTSATGGTGMSINYLDKITGEWVQIWNAQGGSQINIRGGLTDTGMSLVGTIHYVANGTTFPFRGLWTPLEDGRVRQYFEQSNDQGETWSPWFEGFYARRSVAP